jgi:hypothetical protein
LHLLRAGNLEETNGLPLLVCLNHPSWWDPLVTLYLSQRFFGSRRQYAPIATAGLEKYKFFERLGFFSIDPATRAGAARFLSLGEAVLSLPDGGLWVTVQGEFTDVRRRPITMAPGVGHLAHRAGRFCMLPLALEYSFWNERYPEAFACFGSAVMVENGRDRRPAEWTDLFSSALISTQDLLSECVERRDASAFEPLIEGNAGVGGVYDLWRAAEARLRGKRWQPEHGR